MENETFAMITTTQTFINLSDHDYSGNSSTAVSGGYVFPVPVRVVLGLLLLVMACVSIIGNSVACIIVYRKTAMRSAINLLLANMAIGDILLSTISKPFVFYQLLARNAAVNETLCTCFDFVQHVLICNIAYTLMAISVDRYLIIVYRRDKLTPKSAKIIIVVTWICSFMLASPPLAGVFHYESPPQHGGLLCDPKGPTPAGSDAYCVFTVCVAFYLPMALMFYTYACILRTVRKNSHRIHNFPGSTISVSVTQYSSKLGLPPVARPYRHAMDMNSKKRAFGTIFILFIVFLFCWTPYMVNLTVYSLVPHPIHDCVLTVLFLCLGFLKCALYPVVYSIRNKKFREAFCKLLPKSLKVPVSLRKFKKRRVNPRTVYECSEQSSL